ncbi:MAG: Coenzyme F420 hydrogenase/dehydrogenase, beta subunit C-terminal domain [Alistipes onderdonkii]
MIEIRDKWDCCGCNACVQKCPKQCIEQFEDAEGFIYPRVDKARCIGCGLCEKACPVIDQNPESKPLQVLAGWNGNEEIRMQSSSGGVFTLLAEQIIGRGGVVFGARFNENWEVVHGYTESMDGLAAFRGSKYVQSRIGEAFRQAGAFLQQGREVLFTGTPCQIAGLHRFLGKEYGNLFTIDIVCHGVPSPGVWKKYVERLVADLPPEGRLDGIYFRDKCTGWKEYSFSAHLSSPEKTALYTEKFYRNMYMRGFLANLYLRPSCYRCPSKSGKSGADITLADFWGIERIIPRLDDDKGTGLVLVNTAKGKCLYDKLPIISQEVKYEQALKGNHVIETSVPVPPQREIFFDSFGKEDFFRLTDRLTRVPLRTRLRRAAGRLIKLLR